jgi:hypothetical protein
MTFEIFSSIQSHFIRWARHSIMAGGLCLLVACGGGGGGGSSPSAGTSTAPTITLTRSDGGGPVYPGNTAMVLPQFNYGSGTLNWVDSSNISHSQPVVAGTPVSVNPSQTTTYTLSVSYQDPTTVRTSILNGTATLTVTVVTPPSLAASLNLVTSQVGTTTPITSVITGTPVQITPTFSVPAGLTMTSSVILLNDDATAPIAATSGTPVVHTPTINTTYKLKVCYTDTRVIPSVSNCESSSGNLIQVMSAPAKFTTGGLLKIARSDFTTTPLQNGMIMVAGGINSAGTVEKTVELYDPVTNKWTSTGDMKTARRGHAATLLRDGRVLVTGGYDGTVATTALNKAETYDPATGVWTNTTGTLLQARRWHTSTLLNNDKVLIVGGSVSAGGASSKVVELFDPTTGNFSAAAPLRLSRQGHTATLLPTGQVLIVGRNNSDNSLSTVGSFINVVSSRTTEIYTPDSTIGAWTDGPVMTNGRYSHAATLIGNSNQLLVTGGYDAGTDTVEILDVSSTLTSAQTWSLTSTMSVSRALHTSTYLPATNKVLVVGGYNNTTSSMLMSTELFTYGATTPWSTSGNKELALVRAMHTSTLMSNGNVLVLGTYYTTSGTVSNTTEIWTP